VTSRQRTRSISRRCEAHSLGVAKLNSLPQAAFMGTVLRLAWLLASSWRSLSGMQGQVSYLQRRVQGGLSRRYAAKKHRSADYRSQARTDLQSLLLAVSSTARCTFALPLSSIFPAAITTTWCTAPSRWSASRPLSGWLCRWSIGPSGCLLLLEAIRIGKNMLTFSFLMIFVGLGP
jgi:hypothetical protein